MRRPDGVRTLTGVTGLARSSGIRRTAALALLLGLAALLVSVTGATRLERADLILDRPPFNIVRMAQRPQISAVIDELDHNDAVRVIVHDCRPVARPACGRVQWVNIGNCTPLWVLRDGTQLLQRWTKSGPAENVF